MDMYSIELFGCGEDVRVGWLDKGGNCVDDMVRMSEEEVKDVLFGDSSNIGYSDWGVEWRICKLVG